MLKQFTNLDLSLYKFNSNLMKKYLFTFALALPLTVFGQDGNKYNLSSTPPAPVVNLKIEPVSKPGETAVIIGAGLQVVGLAASLVGPSFINTPEDPTTAYLVQLRNSGTNTTAMGIATNRYKSDYSEYISKIDSNKRTANGLRAAGLGVFTIGTAFNISGLMKMIKR